MSERPDPRAADRAIEVEVGELGGKVPAATYHAVFVLSPEGRAILDDLVGRFHDCDLSPDPERTHDVAQAIGSRRVVSFILQRLAQVNVDPKKA